jgi:phosphopantetheinyl transferase (holo-ACP synthase)
VEILHQIKFDQTNVAVGHHQGQHTEPTSFLFESERMVLDQLSPRKKSEWLASRDVLFNLIELPKRAECLYDDFGKPYLKGFDKHISISHSELWCSAMVSNLPCGVDIQMYSSTAERISGRFLSSKEIIDVSKFGHRLHYLHIYWGAKECMYKAYGRKKLEFRSQIFILDVDTQRGMALGEISYEDLHLQYDIHYRILPEAAWVFCLQRPVASNPV